LAITEAFQHIGFPLHIQGAGGAGMHAKTTASTWIIFQGRIRGKVQFRQYRCKDNPRSEFGMNYQIMEAESAKACRNRCMT
jgi:hypothetical protein